MRRTLPGVEARLHEVEWKIAMVLVMVRVDVHMRRCPVTISPSSYLLGCLTVVSLLHIGI